MTTLDVPQGDPETMFFVCDIDANCVGWRTWFYDPGRPYGQCPNCGSDRSEHTAGWFPAT